ncbi:molybdenum cofactor biosynthesis protein MoaE [Rubritalea marina]|uniref:molybdenum cofactor biosynthesis protein MoaE n=1 Tax=Rubritalea marina TaxID=361055 RepID=UPI000363B639|nr:molybdenum cofactor biosynthesis protein MoaE [Rubritalea marina]
MFHITDTTINAEEIRLKTLDPQSGGFVSFEGWVRNHHEGKPVSSLEYSAYNELAEKEGTKIIQEALEKYSIVSAHCSHRVGHLRIGDMAVYVAVSSAHRDAAFEAARYIIDETKTRVPIWKKEHYSDGSIDWPHSKQPDH